MPLGSIGDQTRTALAMLRMTGEAALRRIPALLHTLSAPSFNTPDRILIAPPEIMPGNADRGAAIYAGQYALAGETVDAAGHSIFEAELPSRAFAAALHGFAWLSDLRATDRALSGAHARALVEDWVAQGSRTFIARAPEVTARRIISWLTHSPFLLDGAPPEFHRQFLRGLARQVRRLRHVADSAPPGLPRLTCAIALAAAGLTLPEMTRTLRLGNRRLAAELKAQILPDGGHVSRNPQALVGILFDLLPLRILYASRQLEPPVAFLNAIDRMLPMLRFFRHGDGALALFNGSGYEPAERLDAILAFDDARGAFVMGPAHSGYQRLQAGGTVAILDTGRPPPLALSGEAHAGCLSLELSVGNERVFVNCGAPAGSDRDWRRAARATAAHSTALIGEVSSARFLDSPRLEALLGPLLLEGPRQVPVTRDERPEGVMIRASHDGYARRFGLLHERTVALTAAGDRLDGVDIFRSAPESKPAADLKLMLRFHLHPDVTARRLGDGRAILLMLPSGDSWVFEAEDLLSTLEESVHLASVRGMRRADQIVVHSTLGQTARIGWSVKRSLRPGAAKPPPEKPPADEGLLPL